MKATAMRFVKQSLYLIVVVVEEEVVVVLVVVVVVAVTTLLQVDLLLLRCQIRKTDSVWCRR